jgi:Raf kinase inhibitor-like YbhB/YbcL family protein
MRNIIGISAALLLATATGTASAAPFTLTSTSFKAGGTIDRRNGGNIMGCTGENKSPALEWKNPPAGTKSFALMVHDPDAPTGSGFWHWIVYNIPPDATSLPEGAGEPVGTALPKGAVQGNTDMGTPGWVGPCPPPGTKHHYNFMLFALKVPTLEVPPGATAAIVGFNANANAIGKPAKLTGVYARPKEPAAPKPPVAEPPKDAGKPAK